MDHPNNTINSCKQKHLNFEERMTIQIRLKDGYSPYKIAKELNRASNTIRNEIKRGTVPQLKQGKTVVPSSNVLCTISLLSMCALKWNRLIG